MNTGNISRQLNGNSPSEKESKAVRVLAVVNGDEDYDILRNPLLRARDSSAVIDRARSVVEAIQCLKNQDYDLVLWGGENDSSDQEIEYLRRDHPIPPVLSMCEELTHETVQELIKKTACNHECHSDLNQSCQALAVVQAIEAYRAKKRKEQANVTIEKLRKLVEQSPDLAVITDQYGVIEYVNRAFETVTGYASNEVIGKKLDILQPDNQPARLFAEMWETVLSGNAFRGILVNRKKNGETFILEKSMVPMVDSEGKITHLISTAKDITERRKLEAELQQSQKMDAIGRLAGGVAHDFNNLLMVMSAYSELTLDGLGEGHPLRGNVMEILNASRRAADLTRQLLAFGKKQIQTLQVLDLNSVIHDISRMLPRLIGEDIELTFVPGDGLGKVTADRVQVEQVIMNLAANARDAMPTGGKLTIETRNAVVDEAYQQQRIIVPRGQYVVLSVTDSGEGIAREHLAHIFEPFYTTKEAGKGTGLGLATVYGIVKQSAGYIWVYSEPGLGTTFKIYLPQIQSGATQNPVSEKISGTIEGSETILLVEDETALRESERDFLRQHGYTVLEACDGEEAMRVSREHKGRIHALVTDVVMPKVGGVESAQRLMAERPDMRVLYVSGYAESKVQAHGGIDVKFRFLQKPFSLFALGKQVRAIIEDRAAAAAAN